MNGEPMTRGSGQRDGRLLLGFEHLAGLIENQIAPAAVLHCLDFVCRKAPIRPKQLKAVLQRRGMQVRCSLLPDKPRHRRIRSCVSDRSAAVETTRSMSRIERSNHAGQGAGISCSRGCRGRLAVFKP